MRTVFGASSRATQAPAFTSVFSGEVIGGTGTIWETVLEPGTDYLFFFSRRTNSGGMGTQYIGRILVPDEPQYSTNAPDSATLSGSAPGNLRFLAGGIVRWTQTTEGPAARISLVKIN